MKLNSTPTEAPSSVYQCSSVVLIHFKSQLLDMEHSVHVTL